MTTNVSAGQFKALRGENCNLTSIEGVRSLTTDDGIDLVSIARNVQNTIDKLVSRINELENKISSTSQSTTGKASKIKSIGEITDVDMSGIVDGAILEYNASKKKWVVSVP